MFLVLVLLVGHIVSADKVYTVVPNQSVSNCSGDRTECSLMYYAAHPEQYFREDNIIFHFVSGHHRLVNSEIFHVANISNLTVYGDNVFEVTVVCNGEKSGGFSFYNITNLTITNLSLLNCSHWSLIFQNLIALEVIEAHHMRMENIDIRYTSGVGLSLIDLSGVTVINSTTVDASYSTSVSRGGNFAYECFKVAQNESITNYMYIANCEFRHGYNSFGSKAESSGIFINIDFCSIITNIVLDNVYLDQNYGNGGGNILIKLGDPGTWTTSITILNSRIYNGVANAGGGLCMIAIAAGESSSSKRTFRMAGVSRYAYTRYSMVILRVENTHFFNNTAYFDGGAVYMRLYQNSPASVARMEFVKGCTFTDNKLFYPSKTPHGGVAVHIVTYCLPGYNQHKTIFFEIDFISCTFLKNFLQRRGYNSTGSLPQTGALYTENAERVTLQNCRFVENNCSGVVGIGTNFVLRGENEIRGNTALKGGGIFLCSRSMMHLHNGTILNITGNHAIFSGGGIYVESECSSASDTCFYQLDNVTADNATLYKTQVNLINNTAKAGSAIYGGLVDWCILYEKHSRTQHHLNDSKIFDSTFHITTEVSDLSVISSDPLYVGFCKINGSIIKLTTHNCPLNTSMRIKPGKIFSISAVIMGQRYGLVSALVVAKCNDKDCRIPTEDFSQFISTTAGYLNYTVFSKENRNVSLKLVAEDYYSGFPSYQYQPSFINIFVEVCPLGFIEHDGKCSCLAHIPCDITSQTVHRSSPYWVGYIEEHSIVNKKAIIKHSFCPFGYCFAKSVQIKATVDHFYQDLQCSGYRTGLLCGKCKQNYSLGFGVSQCRACCSTPKYSQYLRIIGLSAVCGVAGILLVVLLTLLNLTVAEGTLNGLIFYANIVHTNLDLFFPADTYAGFWTTFIAWLNLDFGIVVCFYDGMDAYVKTWLQFIFPLYVWVISGGIVYCSRRSRRIAKLAGKNSVKVLATLFLLSFGKLIRIAIAAAYFTTVRSYDGIIHITVWLLDANIQYLYGKHIVLFAVASVAGGVALLYAVILTFIQCLRKVPNGIMCGWIQRLKPLLDAYTGPYNIKYSFWTGLLLLVRITLFTSFAVNFDFNPVLNFTLIITVSTLLIILIQNGVYRNKLVGLLEASIYANLVLFSAFTMLSAQTTQAKRITVVYVFGGWAFLTLVGILLHHGHKQLFGYSVFDRLQNVMFVRSRVRNATTIRPLIIGREVNNMSEESDDELETDNELRSQVWDT